MQFCFSLAAYLPLAAVLGVYHGLYNSPQARPRAPEHARDSRAIRSGAGCRQLLFVIRWLLLLVLLLLLSVALLLLLLLLLLFLMVERLLLLVLCWLFEFGKCHYDPRCCYYHYYEIEHTYIHIRCIICNSTCFLLGCGSVGGWAPWSLRQITTDLLNLCSRSISMTKSQPPMYHDFQVTGLAHQIGGIHSRHVQHLYPPSITAVSNEGIICLRFVSLCRLIIFRTTCVTVQQGGTFVGVSHTLAGPVGGPVVLGSLLGAERSGNVGRLLNTCSLKFRRPPG